MKISAKTSNHKGIRSGLFCFLLVLVSPLFAANATDALGKTDILDVGMNMYTQAREWELETMNGYNQEAFVDFSKKVNALISADPELRSIFKNLCSDCEPIVQETLDTDERLLEYLKNEPKSGAPDIGVIIASHFHTTIKEKIG